MSVTTKPVNQKAWFLILPVLVCVAFSAILPLMTVVNYSLSDTFGNNEFFWGGLEWVEDMNKRGFDGRKLIDTARALIEKHGKEPAAKAPAKKA